ncbi:MAG: hypothetical protein M1839_005319 [Geoglossum umbratile]|nr:MAG: hypothetical protein M1839_005319 [Geoglossum umbratile]
MSAVADLENALQAMQSLKPPGVSGSKINSITALCMANVQSESVLIQKIFTHFKKTPGTHKLGVLYVVDSVTRQWVEQAKKTGQPAGNAAQDGTFAAGVNRVTELLPVLMTDIIQHAPEDQKEKIKKLVDIWERGSTFPAHMLVSFKEKLNSAPPQNGRSTTPDGSPPRDVQTYGMQPTNPSNPPNTSAILAALANIAKQNTAVNPLPMGNSNNVSNTHNGAPQAVPSSVNQAAAMAPPAQPVNVPIGGANLASLFQGTSLNLNAQNQPNAQQQNPLGALASMFPQAQANPAPEVLQQQLMLLQVLAQQGIPQDQWGPIIAALNANSTSGTTSSPAWNSQATAWSGRTEDPSRDRNGRHEPHLHSPPNRYRERSRSPPAWGRDRDSPVPRRRDSPTYGEYNGDSDSRPGNRGEGWDRRGDRGGKARGGRGRGAEYRRRSPVPARRRSASPHDRRRDGPAAGAPKWVDYDYSIGSDKIKVLSRTLFVGGVTCTEDDLRTLFARYGTVQTCIVNHEKRHAFIKMITRQDAIAAKDGMDSHKPADMQLRTRWGVGFGPRDCSDYQTGISVIPIDRLTDADRKWMLTAEYGGSGGKPIEGGMIVEEPDIEIGQGVSSKAISRRMATDQGGKTGPRSTREPRDGPSRYRRNEREDSGNRDTQNPNNAVGVAPSVPGFGFPPIPGFPNGMPIFPPGFTFPGLTSQQPPPPGQNM